MLLVLALYSHITSNGYVSGAVDGNAETFSACHFISSVDACVGAPSCSLAAVIKRLAPFTPVTGVLKLSAAEIQRAPRMLAAAKLTPVQRKRNDAADVDGMVPYLD